MKKPLYLFLVLGLMMLTAGCTHTSREPRLVAVDSMLATRPDSALALLNRFDTTTASQADRMYYRLLLAQAMNKTDSPLAGKDPILHEMVDYYDWWGNANERMKASYMLGCAYRDEGDAPLALKHYRNAVDCADTMATDCDFHTLSRIYGQMANLFNMQRAPRLQLDAQRKAVYYARKAKDTLAAIIFYENLSLPYHMLNQMDSALYYSQKAAKMFKDLGHKELAARTLGLDIDIYLRQKNYTKVKGLMDDYEQYTMFFDQYGNIEQGRDLYYYYKGLYFEGVGQLDSAEFFYRKLLSNPSTIENRQAAYDGLLSLFHRLCKNDSIAKYSKLYCQISDSASFAHSADEITRMQAIYDYTRHQRIANTEARNAERARHYVFVISLCCVVLFVCLYAAYARYKRNKHVEIKHIKEQYESDVEKLEQAKYDLMKMQEKEITHLIEEKAKDICQLQQQIGQYEQALSSTKTVQQLEHHLEANGSYARFRYLSSHPSEKPTEEDWQLLRTMTDELLPDFKTTIYGAAPGLKQADYDICLLVRLYFSPSEVAMLTDNALSAITMKRRRLLERLFHQTGKAETFDRLIRQIR